MAQQDDEGEDDGLEEEEMQGNEPEIVNDLSGQMEMDQEEELEDEGEDGDEGEDDQEDA